MGQPEDAAVPAKPRLIGLDLLRFLAIMLVLGGHLEAPPDKLQLGWRSILTIWQFHDCRSVLWTWHRGGWIGVDLFFVLSGFLISGLLFNEYKSRGTFSIGRFYLRRGWKIYPPFFVLIAATVIATLICRAPLDLRQLASELLFLQSYVRPLSGHTWSLAVEEHFYLLLPLALALIHRWNRNSRAHGTPGQPLRPILPLAAFIAVAALVLRLVNWHYRPNFSNLTHLFPTHLRFDSLFFGVAISYVYHFHTKRFVETLSPWRRWLIVLGAVLLFPAFLWPLRTTPFIFTVGYTLFYLASGLLLVGTLLCDLTRNRALVVMATLGAYSYSIYLWHLVVRERGVQLLERACGVKFGLGFGSALYVVGSILLGVLMAKIVELPALRLRNRWFPSLTSGPIADKPPPANVCGTLRVPSARGTRSVPHTFRAGAEVVGLTLLVGLPLLFTAGAIVWPGSPERLACGDDGNIELFTWHALHDLQLSSIRTHGNLAEHLGPAYFYLLAPLYGLFGCKYQGLQLGALAINLIAIGGVLGVACRCGGRAAMFWAALLLACYARFMTIPWLASVWLPWVVVLPFLATVFLCAAVISGRVYCLPAAAFTASFIVQTQLGYAPALAVVILLTLLSLVPIIRSGWGTAGWLGRSGGGWWHSVAVPQPPAARGSIPKAILITAIVLAVVWTPPAVKQICGMPGRISETIGFFAGGHHEGMVCVHPSWADAGKTLACGLAMFPASLAGFNLKGQHFAAAFDGPNGRPAIVLLLAILQVVLLPIAWLLARRQCRDFDAALCLLAAALVPLCLCSIRSLAGGIEFHHVFWMTSLGLLNVYVFGNASFAYLGSLNLRSRSLVRWVALATILAIAAISLVNLLDAATGLPVVQGKAFDPFMHEADDARIEGGDENDAKRFLDAAGHWLRDRGVGQYRLRIIGLHRSGVATGMILGLTKQGLPPELDPWYALVFSPRQAPPSQPTRGVFLLCNREKGKQFLANPGVQLVAEAQYAMLLWTDDDTVGELPGSGDRL